jgi:CarD family transcriptional regulator
VNFKVGDRVVYPNHGVGIVEKIMSRTIAEKEEDFYSLRILSNDSTVMVPLANTVNVGIRPIMTKKDVAKVYRVLQNGKFAITDDWKGRYQENCEAMRTGSIVDVATVFKNLSLLSQSKNLSYRERKMLDKAKYLIVSEIAEVERAEETKVEDQVDKALGKSITAAQAAAS